MFTKSIPSLVLALVLMPTVALAIGSNLGAVMAVGKPVQTFLDQSQGVISFQISLLVSGNVPSVQSHPGVALSNQALQTGKLAALSALPQPIQGSSSILPSGANHAAAWVASLGADQPTANQSKPPPKRYFRVIEGLCGFLRVASKSGSQNGLYIQNRQA